jgi:Transposase DDE domain group 1
VNRNRTLFGSISTGVQLEFHGSNVTSDAGLLPFRELDDALALTEMAGAVLSDGRRSKNARHVLSGLLRQSVRRTE